MIFDQNEAAGFFLGLSEGGLTFGAELTLNYDPSFQSEPMIGRYIIIELERPDEAVLGRITAISSHGKLASAAGEDLGARAVDQRRPLAEDIKKDFLRYRCSIRILGMLRRSNSKEIIFTPSHRRLPHMGAKVSFANNDILKAVAGGNRLGASIGFLAFGEFIYAQGSNYAKSFSDHFILKGPIVEPKFDAQSMVSRRTAVLARSGYGKSNLLKILFARLYEKQPTISMHDGTKKPVGTLILDPDGDYFWPGSGANSPPGLCDIPELKDSIVVFTDRQHPNPYYNAFKISTPKINLRDLPPKLVLSCSVSLDRMNQRGTEALMRIRENEWVQLVDAAYLELKRLGELDTRAIQQLCRLSTNNYEAIALGIRSTMLDIVARLHDPESLLVAGVKRALADGKLVVIDLSMMRGQAATALSAMLLRMIFEHNVEEHTKPEGAWIPTIALIEEAQKVLEGSSTAHAPFIEWVKEGRKYHLGAVLVTQQPGAIDNEILSQTDNFFVFHLISGGDLTALKNANGHFSDDILAGLLNEPIEGQGVFWSSAGEKSTFPIPFRAFNFSDLYRRLSLPSQTEDLYAKKLYDQLLPLKGKIPDRTSIPEISPTDGLTMPSLQQLREAHYEAAKLIIDDFGEKTERPLFVIEKILKERDGFKRKTKQLTMHVLTAAFGLYGYGWELENRISKKNGTNYICIVKKDVEKGKQFLNDGKEPLIKDQPEYADSTSNDEDEDDIF
ncbi:MAG: DUF87 domain-containing protein [Verrucomicrobia bacterium]|nr:DUF87 domain-containing protein [Verrucomicrobiota bacterium]